MRLGVISVNSDPNTAQQNGGGLLTVSLRPGECGKAPLEFGIFACNLGMGVALM